MGQKVVSIRPHFPTVKHTPAKESKVHNGGGPYLRPDLRISWSLHVWGSPARTWDSRSITVRALTLTLILFPQLFWGPSSLETALSASQILPTKDLRDLLTKLRFLPGISIATCLYNLHLILPICNMKPNISLTQNDSAIK